MQFDVHPNPIPGAHRAYPYVVVRQADTADTGRDRIVAMLGPQAGMPGVAVRLTPIVSVRGDPYALMLPSLAGFPVTGLPKPVGNLSADRDRIVAGLDWLFLGV